MTKTILSLLFSLTTLLASVPYSGNSFTATVTATGTKQDLIDDIETALLNGGGGAGWTTISGSGTTDLLMASGTTAQSLQIYARFKDNSGTGIQVYLESTDGSLKPASYTTSNGGTLLATNLLSYKVVASKYQFLIYTANATTSRQFVWVGMPYLNTTLAANITRAGWMVSSAASDSDGTSRCHLRNAAAMACNAFNAAPNYELMVNSSWWENANDIGGNTNSAIGAPRLLLGGITSDLNYTISSATGYRWRTATPSIVTSDVLVAWGSTGTTAESMINGQLFDCLFIADSQPINTTSTFDSHDWINITNSNTGSGSNYVRGGVWCSVTN